MNDYDAIFRILAEHGYQGWASIEDGMNGMDEMAQSRAFLRHEPELFFRLTRFAQYLAIAAGSATSANPLAAPKPGD